MTRPLVMAIGVGLIALTVYCVGLAPELTPRSSVEQDLPFQVTDPVWLQQGLPRLGGPDSWWPSGLLARAWVSLPSSWNLNLLSAALAATAAALLTFIVSASVGAPAGAVAGVGFAISPTVWSAAVAAEGDVSVLFLAVNLLIALACVGAWVRTGHGALLAGAVGALAVAAAQDLVIGLAAASGVAATTARRRPRRLWLGAATAAAVLAVAYQAWALGALLGPRLADEGPSGIADAWIALWRWGFEPGSTAGDILQARVTALASTVALDIGALGCIVGALGLHRSVPLLGALTSLALAAFVGPVPGAWDPAMRAVLPLMAAWVLIGLGLSRVASWVPSGGRPVAVLLCLLLPAYQAVRITAEAPQLTDRPAGHLLDAFVHQQSSGTAVVIEGIRFGRLMAWANHRLDPSRRFDLEPHDPKRLSSLLAAGRTIVATDTAADRLSLSGFTGTAFPVYGRSLEDLLQSASPSALVGLVATPGTLDSQPQSRQAVIQLAKDVLPKELGHDDALLLLARRADRLTYVALDASGVDVSAATGGLPALAPSLQPRDDTRLAANESGARLLVDDFELAHVARGAIFTAWSPLDGSLEWSVLDSRQGLTAPWRHSRWGLNRLGTRAECTVAGRRGWSDVTSLASAARIGVELPERGRLRFYIARDRGLFIRGATFSGRPSPETTIVRWDRSLAEEASTARAALEADGLPPHDWSPGARFLWQITIASPDNTPALLALGLGGRPDWARVRLESEGAPTDATLCAGVAGARLFAREGLREDSISLADGDSFGQGWLPVSRAGRERWRQTSGSQAEILARVDQQETIEVVLAARPGALLSRPARIGLHVNGTPAGAQVLLPQGASYAWTVPGDRWRVGTNHLIVTVEAGEPLSGAGSDPPVLHVTSIRLRH